jgi:hypothetical protein
VNEYVVDFTVTFSVVIDAESESDAERLAEDEEWREDVLDTRTAWDDVVVETEVSDPEWSEF